MSDWRASDYPTRAYYFDPKRDANEPRLRPGSQQAKRTRRAAWTETYVFFGVEGAADTPGVTYATPVEDKGAFAGALTADFDLYALSEFLRTLRIAESGFAFIVEERADHTRRVIAHPDPTILMRDVQRAVTVHELVDPDKLADARVRALIGRIPRDAAAGALELVRFTAGAKPYLGGYLRLGPDQPRWVVCMVVPEVEVMGRVQKSNLTTFIISLVSLVVAVLLSIVVSSRVARPLGELSRQASAIGQLRLESPAPPRSPIKEIDELGMAMEGMKVGLRSFRKYVPAELVRTLLASGEEAKIGGHRATLTIYFSDIAGFTGIAEKMSPEQLADHLGEYLDAVSAEIAAQGGTVDKYIGDAVMAFWGAPAENADHALAAVRAALRHQAAVEALRRRWRAEGKPEFHARIGVHSGEVVVGNLGSASRLNYTVLGDAVNFASRLEGLNKHYGTSILLSDATLATLGDRVVTRPIDRVAVKGKSRGVGIHELLGLRGEVDDATVRWARTCAGAVDAYFARRFTDAVAGFAAALALRPGDLAAERLKARAAAYEAAPPDADWDGVYAMDSK
jgi:adenylate cyclase